MRVSVTHRITLENCFFRSVAFPLFAHQALHNLVVDKVYDVNLLLDTEVSDVIKTSESQL